MKALRGLGALALAAASAAGGWWLHAPDAPAPTVDAAAQPVAPQAQAPSQRLSVMAWPRPAEDGTAEAVHVHEDGTATVQAQHRAPAWIVAELCRQGARLQPGACGGAAPVGATAPAGAEDNSAALTKALRQGDAAQRYDALAQARTAGVLLPEAELMRLMAQDKSDQVRLAAFDNFIEVKSGDVDALRDALQAVLRIPHTQLQARAREQLDGIEQFHEQSAALMQQQRQP